MTPLSRDDEAYLTVLAADLDEQDDRAETAALWRGIVFGLLFSGAFYVLLFGLIWLVRS